jgi:S-adenosylmethionine/arginine decarboxylase-like enzyme
MTSGYSLVQLIETSSIVAHFSEGTNKVYLNVFSCKEFDPADAAAFCRKFFKAKGNRRRFLIRK